MLAEIGHFALILALMVALVQGASLLKPIAGAYGTRLFMIVDRAAILQFLLVAVAFGVLTAAFVVSDFSLLNVALNSHSAKPMLYKVAGVWGNHEGSLILWVLILSGFGAAIAVFGGGLPKDFRARVLAVQALIGVGFLLFSLLTSNPFERLSPVPMDGNGLNPLLQDPGLAFHPPFLYLGYVGFSVAFSFAMAALIEGRVDPAWARWVRPWTLAAWCSLTAGIALGSWWAYYELGWGGWWFWDPVENASFMPWLSGTALLHSAIVVEKRDSLKSWTILLAIITFSLSLLGTFLVRSGVLTSVHAFANDPARGIFILAFLIVVTGGALTLYALRAGALKPGGLFAPVSRETGLVINNLLLATAAATVLLGTLYPLFLGVLTGDRVSVGPPYFNAVFVPLMVPLIVLMAAGPLLSWKRADLGAVLARLKAAFMVAIAAMLMTAYWQDTGGVLSVFGLGLGFWLLGGIATEFAGRIGLFRLGFRDTLARLRHLPGAAWGMSTAHAGFAVMVIGISASISWQVEKLQILLPGESVDVGAYTYRFDGVRDVEGPNYSAVRGTFTVLRDGQIVTQLLPETRTYSNPPMTTTEAAIRPALNGDLYAVIGERDPATGGWTTRLYNKPLVSWIWGGALIMVVGGLFSLMDRRFRLGVPRKARRLAPGSAELGQEKRRSLPV